jgi:fatty-acyl-CoA synthase
VTPASFIDLLARRAALTPDAIAFRFLAADETWDSWSWRDASQRVVQAAAGLRAAGVGRGSHVLLIVPDVALAVPCLLGCWAVGAVPIQMGLPHHRNDIGAVLSSVDAACERLGVATIVTSRMVLDALPAATGLTRPVCAADDLVCTVARGWHACDPSPTDTALIQLTSGSTGRPRGVVIPHGRLMLHMRGMSDALPSHERSEAVSWLPLHHDMGLIGGLLFPFYNGFPVSLLSPLDFRARPSRWMDAMSRYGATICAAPPSAYAIVARNAEKAIRGVLDLSRWECAMIGAEPVSAALLRAFAEAYAPAGFRPQAFFPVYGLAEATVAVTFPRLLAPTRVDRLDRRVLETEHRAVPGNGSATIELVGLGRPIPGTEVVIEADGRLLGDREVGEICVRAPTLMTGYYGEPDETADVLGEDWLRTGDLGYRADGDLFVTGRRKELIIRGGRNLIPSVLEEIAGAVPGVRAGCVAAVGIFSDAAQTERVYLLAETKIAADAERTDLAQRLRAALDRENCGVDQIVLIRPGELPKTTSGKVMRLEAARQLESGALSAG